MLHLKASNITVLSVMNLFIACLAGLSPGASTIVRKSTSVVFCVQNKHKCENITNNNLIHKSTEWSQFCNQETMQSENNRDRLMKYSIVLA